MEINSVEPNQVIDNNTISKKESTFNNNVKIFKKLYPLLIYVIKKKLGKN